MPDLKLIALDTEDLAALSAHLQDAVVRVGDMAFLKSERRFALVANRFDWAAAATGKSRSKSTRFERRRTGLRFEHVREARVSGFDLKRKSQFLVLLAVTFEGSGPPESPEGFVTLYFSGGAAIRLGVECIEAELKDLGGAWTTPRKPEHNEPGA